MKQIEFKNNSFSMMNSIQDCNSIFDITDNIKLGEYAEYGDKYIFKTEHGIYAAYKDDLSNNWEI